MHATTTTAAVAGSLHLTQPQEPAPTSDDFFWSYTEEPHRTRRQAIVKTHPEVGFPLGLQTLETSVVDFTSAGYKTLRARAIDKVPRFGRGIVTNCLRRLASQHSIPLLPMAPCFVRGRGHCEPESIPGYPRDLS